MSSYKTMTRTLVRLYIAILALINGTVMITVLYAPIAAATSRKSYILTSNFLR
jgi:phage shock protein PspC (stress-responsive transcriptional regulator)